MKRIIKIGTGIGLTALLAVATVLLVPREGLWPFCERLYTNATFLTMNAKNEVADALLSSCGQITYVGTLQQAQQRASWFGRSVNLQGATVVPGFIDAHSHFPLVGLREVSVDLSPPPGGRVDSLAALYTELEKHLTNSSTDDWLLGFNYDNTLFADGRHPDRHRLDELSPDRPIYLRHNSGHMGVANTRGLALLGVLGDAAAAGNLSVRKFPGTFEPDGLLLESAAPDLGRFIQNLTVLELWRLHQSGVQQYAAAGYTTVQAGGVNQSTVRTLRQLSFSRLLPLRLVVWPNESASAFALDRVGDSPYFKIGPIKVYGDGSPQGYTAYLTQPYHRNLTEEQDYRGYPVKTQLQWQELIAASRKRGQHLAIHTNGDAAIDDVLAAVESVQEDSGPALDSKVTLVHAQTMRLDQVKQAAALGIDASFFVSHTFFWGDWHRTTALGAERAANISPLRWARDHGLPYTLHTDAPVTPPSALHLLWTATERRTRSDYVLGPEQRISRLEGLRALTIDSARQARLQQHRGSLESGKATDMVVLSADPLMVDDVRELQVLQTIVGGQTVYRNRNITQP